MWRLAQPSTSESWKIQLAWTQPLVSKATDSEASHETNLNQTVAPLFPSADRSQAQEILDAGLQCQSPSKVCRACFECNPGAVWLMWLKCTNQEEHKTNKTVTVIVSQSYRQLVKLRELPSGVSKLSELELCRISTIGVSTASRCERGGSCRQAHSQEELNYWKWQIVNRLYAKKVGGIIAHVLILMYMCTHTHTRTHTHTHTHTHTRTHTHTHAHMLCIIHVYIYYGMNNKL